jgi:hypothetical protein
MREGRIRSASLTSRRSGDPPGSLEVGLAGLQRDEVG